MSTHEGDILAPRGTGLTYRGVAYDCGSNHETGQGSNSRMVWSDDIMRTEIDSIADGLKANSVTIYGTLFDRLEATTAYAIERGLHVWLQPRLMDGEQPAVLEHIGKTAALAEKFRLQGADIHVSVGCTHAIQTMGIMPGEFYHNRMGNAFPDSDHHFLRPVGPIDHDDVERKLNAFLAKAVEVARANFGGGITYSAGSFERVDWTPFDYIGIVDYYHPKPDREAYLAELAAYRKWNKPIMISEYGTFTYKGASEKGLLGFDIVDRTVEPPRVFDGFVRDEQAQADFHLDRLRLYDEFGIYSVAVTEFVHPTHPHSEDPQWDLDTASMTITKTIRDDYFDHFTTYHIEPKESYKAIARYYEAVTEREHRAAA
ncbi:MULTISPECIES: hypothetical protein [unclassified Amycolatopsis]|uniref:hypothetical protein n=1 Tax=unclassified Amycolatopsis TaxID=2618356 RepID=UPI002E1E181F|nr:MULTISPECIES: hypothetical protein [unclassified Amycolatopsis]